MSKKTGIVAGVLAAIAILSIYSLFFMKRDWAGGHKLNPYQVDEVVVAKWEPNPYVAEQGFKIRNGKWIRDALDTVKHLKQVKAPEHHGQEAYSFYVPGKFQFLISHGSNGWVIFDEGHYYHAPKALLDKLLMSRDQFLQMENTVGWTDWRPFVMIDGKPYFAKPSEKRYSQSLKPIFQVHQLPENPSFHFDVRDLKNHSGSYQDGTGIYHIDGKYYVRAVKEPDQMNMLVPAKEE